MSVNPQVMGSDAHAGGLTSKVHAAVDGRGRPLAAVVTGGHRNDGGVLAWVLGDIREPRLGRGRPRTRPHAVIADKAYSAGSATSFATVTAEGAGSRSYREPRW